MGTFTSGGKEYDMPAVPAEYLEKPSLARAWRTGWGRGIYSDFATFKRYQKPALQAAFDAGHLAAREQRRAAGESVNL